MLDGLIMAWVLFAWGMQAAVPWRLPGAQPRERRLWAFAALPLLAAGTLAAFWYLESHPDAAIARDLFPLRSSRPGRALLVLLPALALAGLVTAAGWRRMEAAGWRITAGFGLAFLAAASWAGELVRTGEGPASAPPVFALLVACRLTLALAAGEIAAPGRPLLAVAGGLALPLYWLLLPVELAERLSAEGQLFTLGAAALLLLASRWVPPRLRRPALVGGILLAGLFLARAADLSQTLATRACLRPSRFQGPEKRAARMAGPPLTTARGEKVAERRVQSCQPPARPVTTWWARRLSRQQLSSSSVQTGLSLP